MYALQFLTVAMMAGWTPEQRLDLATAAVAAGTLHGSALEYVTEAMMEDWSPQQRLDLATAAVEQGGRALKFVTAAIMADWSPQQRLAVATTAVKKNGDALVFVTTAMRADWRPEQYFYLVIEVVNDKNQLLRTTHDLDQLRATIQWLKVRLHYLKRDFSFDFTSEQKYALEAMLVLSKPDHDYFQRATQQLLPHPVGNLALDDATTVIEAHKIEGVIIALKEGSHSLEVVQSALECLENWRWMQKASIEQRFKICLAAMRSNPQVVIKPEWLNGFETAQLEHLALLQVMANQVSGLSVAQIIKSQNMHANREIQRTQSYWSFELSSPKAKAHKAASSSVHRNSGRLPHTSVDLKEWIIGYAKAHQSDCLSALLRIPDIKPEVLDSVVGYLTKQDPNMLSSINWSSIGDAMQRMIVQQAIKICGPEAAFSYLHANAISLADSCKKVLWAENLRLEKALRSGQSEVELVLKKPTKGKYDNWLMPKITSFLDKYDKVSLFKAYFDAPLISNVPAQSAVVESDVLGVTPLAAKAPVAGVSADEFCTASQKGGGDSLGDEEFIDFLDELFPPSTISNTLTSAA